MGNAESDLKQGDDSTQVTDGNSVLNNHRNQTTEHENFMNTRQDDETSKKNTDNIDDKHQVRNLMKKFPYTLKNKRNIDSKISQEQINNHGDSSQPSSNSLNHPLNIPSKVPQHTVKYETQQELHNAYSQLLEKGNQSEPLTGFETPHSRQHPSIHNAPKHPNGPKPQISAHAINNSKTPNGTSTGKTNKTINVMMYPSHTRSPATTSIDPSKLMESLKIDEAEWETKWENDDNDDDSSEDEDKEDEIKNLASSGGASSHPFRPGMDLGHSSASLLNSRLNNARNHMYPTSSNVNNMSSLHSAQNRMEHPNRTSQHAPTHKRYAASLYGNRINPRDDQHTYGSSDRPGVRMFSMLRVLGKGSFGKVVLVKKRSGDDRGVLFAMKILRKSHLSKKRQIERTKTERKVLSIVDHPFIMKLYFAFQTEDKLFFVLEYCSGGELFFHLSRYRRFPERVARFYTSELLLALGHLHRRGIIFRDLKPENILLDAAGHVKLGDFGLSKDRISDPCEGATSYCGTFEYMAPEVISRSGHGFCVDYWGLGMLVFEMMTSLPPWYTTDREELNRRLLYAPLEIPDYISNTSANFVSSLLEREPRRRLGVHGIRSVMDHSFFRDIEWNDLKARRVQPPIRPCEGWRARRDDLDTYTSNFDPSFTRMPLHTDEHHIDSQHSGSDYEPEDIQENTFVGFTYDEVNEPRPVRRGHQRQSNRMI